MRRIHLAVVAPLLGAGLVLGVGEASQASPPSGSTTTLVQPRIHSTNPKPPEPRATKRRLPPTLAGFRDGYRMGFRDGLSDCRRLSAFTRRYESGWMRGYNAGFTAGCSQVRHGRPYGGRR